MLVWQCMRQALHLIPSTASQGIKIKESTGMVVDPILRRLRQKDQFNPGFKTRLDNIAKHHLKKEKGKKKKKITSIIMIDLLKFRNLIKHLSCSHPKYSGNPPHQAILKWLNARLVLKQSKGVVLS